MKLPDFKYGRKDGFHIALSLLAAVSNPSIVEVGVIRGRDEEDSNGYSTKVFADFILKNQQRGMGGNLISVDIYLQAVQFCLQVLKDSNLLSGHITVVCADAIEFMQNRELREKLNCNIQKIDLLYVDGWDYSENPETNAVSEQSTLQLVQLAEPFFLQNSLILFDDVYNDEWAGKAKRAIPWLLSKGWLTLFRRNNQALLIKNIYEV